MRAVLFLLVVLLAAFAHACGDDDDSTPTPRGSGAIDGNAEQQLRALAGSWAEASARISYDLTNSAGAAEVIVFRQPTRIRIDHTLGDRFTSIVVRENEGYSCSGLSNSCALVSAEEAAEAATFVPYVTTLADSESVNKIISGADSIEIVDSETIAGEEPTCVKATGTLGGIAGPTTFCFSEDGLLLAVKYEGTPAFDMTANEIGEIEDSDFDPPLVVITVPPTASATATP